MRAGGWCNVIGSDGRRLLEKCPPPSLGAGHGLGAAATAASGRGEAADSRRVSLSAAEYRERVSPAGAHRPPAAAASSGWGGGSAAPLYAGLCYKIERCTSPTPPPPQLFSAATQSAQPGWPTGA